DMSSEAANMLEAAGFKNIYTYNDKEKAPGIGIHEMGTSRMGRDRKTSVLNGNNQVWGAENVFVTDGACMTSASCVNPSLTFMALTARAANFAVEELKSKIYKIILKIQILFHEGLFNVLGNPCFLIPYPFTPFINLIFLKLCF
ncbi:MAG TPA: GMC family oxidoreductase, partial [Saprospiraceae bacterium]|nr:GMC family oxidoreductase [Saprospiraceae bacterium]